MLIGACVYRVLCNTLNEWTGSGNVWRERPLITTLVMRNTTLDNSVCNSSKYHFCSAAGLATPGNNSTVFLSTTSIVHIAGIGTLEESGHSSPYYNLDCTARLVTWQHYGHNSPYYIFHFTARLLKLESNSHNSLYYQRWVGSKHLFMCHSTSSFG